MHDEELEEGRAFGVHCTRRGVLWLAAGVAAAAGRASGEAAKAPGPAWQELIDRAPGLAPLAADRSPAGTDAYLHAVASLAVRVAAVPAAKLFPYPDQSPFVSLAPIHRGVPFAVIEWWMEPGAVFPPHNHPGYSVCTLGLEGEAVLRHFEPGADAPPHGSNEPFRVRLTRELVLGPRTVSTLSPSRDNLHSFTAGPRGARGIDVTTLHAPADTGFSFVELKDAASARAGSTLEARWRKL